jgi:hypothetical protein
VPTTRVTTKDKAAPSNNRAMMIPRLSSFLVSQIMKAHKCADSVLMRIEKLREKD